MVRLLRAGEKGSAHWQAALQPAALSRATGKDSIWHRMVLDRQEVCRGCPEVRVVDWTERCRVHLAWGCLGKARNRREIQCERWPAARPG